MRNTEEWVILKRVAFELFDVDVDTVYVIPTETNRIIFCGRSGGDSIDLVPFLDSESGRFVYIGYSPRNKLIAFRFAD